MNYDPIANSAGSYHEALAAIRRRIIEKRGCERPIEINEIDFLHGSLGACLQTTGRRLAQRRPAELFARAIGFGIASLFAAMVWLVAIAWVWAAVG